MSTKKTNDTLSAQISSTLDKELEQIDEITAARLEAMRREALAAESQVEHPVEQLQPFPYRLAIAASVMLMIITVPIFRGGDMQEGGIAKQPLGPTSESHFSAEEVELALAEDLDFIDTMEMLAVLDTLEVLDTQKMLDENTTFEYL